MQVERVRPTVFQLTLHAYELAALIGGARWIAAGAEGELPEEARTQLRAIVESYDAQSRREDGAHRPEGPDTS